MINKDQDPRESFNMNHYLNNNNPNNNVVPSTNTNEINVRESMNFKIPSFQPDIGGFNPNSNLPTLKNNFENGI
jgi:hypothetical protein